MSKPDPSSSFHTKLQTLIAELQDDAYLQGHKNGKKRLGYDFSFDRKADQSIAQILQAFQEAGYIKLNVKPGDIIAVNAETYKLNGDNSMTKILQMTGQEFYDRFKAEYHNKADWISSDPTMGADAEHDVLLCARLAAGVSDE